MIEREGWNHCLICDHCEDYKDGFDEFEKAVEYKKKKGWQVFLLRDELRLKEKEI